ncbi:peptidase C14, caspase domain-containing protein [Trametes elegans]|nr:peptidase C14, caspase domain-containing protein [Trametes elegans]
MGAHKDTKLMKNLLLRLGYRLEDIRILIDLEGIPLEDQPTRDNILSAMETLVNNAVPGDHLVFLFSGHGEQLATGDIHEIDGHDEIIPMDAGELDKPIDNAPLWSNYIVDDEFRAIFGRLPYGVRCALVFDCCNSGTAADLPDVTDDIDIVHKHHGPLRQPNWQDEPQGPEPMLNGPSLTSWSACRDGDSAPGNNAGGILVRAFCKALKRVDPEDSNSYLWSTT